MCVCLYVHVCACIYVSLYVPPLLALSLSDAFICAVINLVIEEIPLTLSVFVGAEPLHLRLPHAATAHAAGTVAHRHNWRLFPTRGPPIYRRRITCGELRPGHVRPRSGLVAVGPRTRAVAGAGQSRAGFRDRSGNERVGRAVRLQHV